MFQQEAEKPVCQLYVSTKFEASGIDLARSWLTQALREGNPGNERHNYVVRYYKSYRGTSRYRVPRLTLGSWLNHPSMNFIPRLGAFPLAEVDPGVNFNTVVSSFNDTRLVTSARTCVPTFFI
jgi:hypothetical protein